MNNSRKVDLSVGILMLLGLLSLLMMAMKVSGVGQLLPTKGFHIFADFTDIGGLKVHAPVTVAGVKIGEVTKIELKAGELSARVTMELQPQEAIPYQNASARILTEGILGSKYVSIVPGFADDEAQDEHAYLQEGDSISNTQEAVILENLIGQLLFNIKK